MQNEIGCQTPCPGPNRKVGACILVLFILLIIIGFQNHF